MGLVKKNHRASGPKFFIRIGAVLRADTWAQVRPHSHIVSNRTTLTYAHISNQLSAVIVHTNKIMVSLHLVSSGIGVKLGL